MNDIKLFAKKKKKRKWSGDPDKNNKIYSKDTGMELDI